MINVDVDVTNSTMTDEEVETLKSNIKFFCSTPKGSLPQMRDYGLNFAILDENFITLRMKATVDIISGIRKFYGVQITNIDITADKDGKVTVKIKI